MEYCEAVFHSDFGPPATQCRPEFGDRDVPRPALVFHGQRRGESTGFAHGHADHHDSNRAQGRTVGRDAAPGDEQAFQPGREGWGVPGGTESRSAACFFIR